MDFNIDQLVKTCDHSIITRWARGDVKDIQGPWLIYINLSNRCNSRCYYCALSGSMRDEKGFMDIDLYKRIIHELPDSVRKVYLIKQGEPFAHKEFEYYVEILAEIRPDIHICIHTNGIIAREHRVATVLPHLSSMGISVSAINRENYKKVHQVDKFDLVMRNMKAISDIALTIPKETRPHVFIDYVLNERNRCEDQAEVVEFFRERFPGIASVDFHYLFNYTGEIEEANLKIYDELPFSEFPTCVFPWSSMTFLWDGNIGYCFVEPRENRFLGNIKEQSFDEIWNGEEYQLFRRRMWEHKYDELRDDGFYCHQCTWLWSPHSMAPRNLAYGYATDLDEKNKMPHFGELLQAFPKETFERGVDFYLAGEVHQAVACFNLVAATNNNPELSAANERLLKLCEILVDRYKNLGHWHDTLAKEGVNPDQRMNTYHAIGENDDAPANKQTVPVA